MLAAVIGIGGIARKAYLPVLGVRAGLDLIVCSRREETVARTQAEYRIPRGTTDLDEVIRAGPQAAFVLTPNAAHYEIVRQLLEAGIDVYVEKPATLVSAQTRELGEIADRLGRVFMVGFNRRFAPLHRQARDLLAEKPPDLARLQKDRPRSSSPTLFDLYIDDTIHQVDLLRFFCGEGEAVSTQAVSLDGKVVSSLAFIALERGGLAVIATGFHAGEWQETYEFAGAGQTVAVDAFMRLRQTKGDEERVWQESYASSWQTTLEARGFTGMIEHFLQCVETRSRPETPAEEALKSQLLVEQIVERAKIR